MDALSTIEEWQGIHTEFDYPIEPTDINARHEVSLSSGASYYADLLAEFKSRHNLDRIVTIYLGSPNSAVPGIEWEKPDIHNIPKIATCSGLMYAVGSVLTGSHFVDFTPSTTLDVTPLFHLASITGSRLAGRDGSPGETMLKAVLLEMFARRNLLPSSWFSTNLLGNHDGLVLSNPEYSRTKQSDKLSVFDPVSPTSIDHLVDIRFMPEWGTTRSHGMLLGSATQADMKLLKFESIGAVAIHGWLLQWCMTLRV